MKSVNLTEQTSLFQYNNKDLFSNYYLDNYIKRFPEWKEEERLKPIFEKIKQIYFKNKSYLTSYNEAQLERNFIQPILKLLGHFFEIQEATKRIAKRPDYAFFADERAMKEALKNKGEEDFYRKAISVGDAKAWAVPLDRKFRGKEAYTFENPSLQIDIYLRETPPEWGILTNGKSWRIYYEKTSHKLDSYYEVDLQNIILKDDLEGFKYFYLFFRREAFILDPTGRTFLDRVYEGSVEYARELGEELKENIYEALKLMAQGFFDWKKNNLKATPETLEIIRQNSLIFLYRLLFIFYAESRELLPKEHHYSLDSIKKIITEQERRGESPPTYTDDFWRRFGEFFDLINEGSEARGIPRKELYIPAYNGGLFDPNIHQFIKNNSISDYYCAEVIDLLARARPNDEGPAFVDYSTLEIRHLGSIYEGLLENKFKIAEQDLIAIREKQREIWVSTSEIKNLNQPTRGKRVIYKNKNYRIADIALEGSVYLVTDKGERKATGSYYTPDYVVEYIVKNTLGPIIDEKKKSDGDLINEILNIKVLDPAMGSGHFLVEATDFLARALVEALGEKGKQLEEDEIRWARREVVERCIFGVDLNPLAVELAKLSLWLSTVSTNNALSFLDHHLKCGNSLIGAKIDELGQLPDLKKSKNKEAKTMGLFEPEFMKRVGDFLKVFEKIETMPSDTAEQVKEKTRIYNEEFEKKSIPFKTIANLWLSEYFGNEVLYTEYTDLQTALTNEKSEYWKKYSKETWFREALEIAEEKHFFYWELEFPEVFFAKGKRKSNPGFDVIIGNPPYINVAEIPLDEREFLMKSGIFLTPLKRMDIFVPFHERSINLLSKNGHHSFIVPFPLLTQDYGQKLRVFFLNETVIQKIADLSKWKIFPETTVRNIIPIFRKTKDNNKLNYEIEVITQKKDPNVTREIKGESKYIEASQYQDTYKNMFRIDLSPESHSLQKKIDSLSIKFGNLCAGSWGARGTPTENFHLDEQKNKYCKKMIKGENVDHYHIDYTGKWFLYDIKKLYRPSMPVFFENPKLTFQKVTGERGPIGAYDDQRFYTDDSLICCIPKYHFEKFNKKVLGKHKIKVLPGEIENSKKYSLLYMLAIMNSLVTGFYFKKFIGYELNVYPENIEYLPVRKIRFTTPKSNKEQIFEGIKKNIDSLNSDRVLELVEQSLTKDEKGKIIKEKEKSDVIHDVLIYIVRQTIALNSKKQEFIDDFLNWISKEIIKQEIKDLKYKTKIKEFYKYQLEDLLKILKQSKCVPDPIPSKILNAIQNEFNEKANKLIPLDKRVNSIVKLIDQIIYKLYSLTDGEIKLIEESVSK